MKSVHIFLIALCFGACHQKSNKPPEEHKKDTAIKTKPSACFSYLDTGFENGDYVKYVADDTGTDIEVRLNNTVDRLIWGFSCEIHGVPQVCKHTDSIIILTRGAGFHFREAIVFELNGSGISKDRFETTLSSYAPNDCYVYLHHSNQLISVLNKLYRTVQGADDELILDEKTLPLPFKYQNDSLLGTEVYQTEIILKFLKNGNLIIPVK